MGIAKFRVLEFALALANEVIDLGGSNARDFEFDRRQSAGTDRQFPFAAQREQAALTFDLHFARQLRHGDDRVVVFRQPVIARRTHAFCDADVKLALRFDPYLKAVLSILRLFRGHNSKFDSFGLIEDIVRHLGRTLPF